MVIYLSFLDFEAKNAHGHYCARGTTFFAWYKSTCMMHTHMKTQTPVECLHKNTKIRSFMLFVFSCYFRFSVPFFLHISLGMIKCLVVRFLAQCWLPFHSLSSRNVCNENRQWIILYESEFVKFARFLSVSYVLILGSLYLYVPVLLSAPALR